MSGTINRNTPPTPAVNVVAPKSVKSSSSSSKNPNWIINSFIAPYRASPGTQKFFVSAAALFCGEVAFGYPIEKLGILKTKGLPIVPSLLWKGVEAGAVYRLASRQVSIYGLNVLPPFLPNHLADTVVKTTGLTAAFLIMGGMTVDNLRLGKQLNDPMLMSYKAIANKYARFPVATYMDRNSGFLLAFFRNVINYLGTNLGLQADKIGLIPKSDEPSTQLLYQSLASALGGGIGGFLSSPLQKARVDAYATFCNTSRWPDTIPAITATLKEGAWLKFSPFRSIAQAGFSVIYCVTMNYFSGSSKS
ncbi:MAG: hypothetical protein EXS67_01825 [Candidatus Margulisbacteria bacterium]|nr:hypothetical protein [Candidatus Margulisiibacteriota bacterium]